MSKEFNRAQDERAFQKAKRIAKLILFRASANDIIKLANHIKNNRKACSCSMCCNPRRDDGIKKNEKLTMQERRANANERD